VKINVDGRFEVSVGSEVRIVSEAQDMNQNLAAYPDHTACSGSVSLPLTITDDGLKRTGSFKVSQTAGQICTVRLSFDFKPDASGDIPDGARYSVKLIERRADGSEDVFDDPVAVKPPPLGKKTYSFIAC